MATKNNKEDNSKERIDDPDCRVPCVAVDRKLELIGKSVRNKADRSFVFWIVALLATLLGGMNIVDTAMLLKVKDDIAHVRTNVAVCNSFQ